MKYFISLRPTSLTFSRKLILCRDNYTCAYCNKKFSSKALTIDHIIPKSIGGMNTFTNCVTACLSCNLRESNKTPEQANMNLFIVPSFPDKYLFYYSTDIKWHEDWLFFFNNY